MSAVPQYPTSIERIIDALEGVIADLRELPNPTAELPEIGVTLHLQALNHAPSAERMKAVDLLGWAVTGMTGRTEEDGRYRSPYGASQQSGLTVRVFTAPLGVTE